jgi:RimJ/RimL family protein N-acetyltransferase
MTLRPIEKPEAPLVHGWLTDPQIGQWLDFGTGEPPSRLHLKLMMEDKRHCLRVYTPDPDGAPIGLVAFSNIHTLFRTAMIWYLLGVPAFAGQGHTARAVAALLDFGFGDLGLRAVNAWTVERNAASISILKRNGFRLIGRQRQCHIVDGETVDRLLFDVLCSERRLC